MTALNSRYFPAIYAGGRITYTQHPWGLAPGKYVWQRTVEGAGNVPDDATHTWQLRRWVRGTDKRSLAQLTRRQLFRQAVAYWRRLTTTEKASWRSTAKNMGAHSGYHLCLSRYLLHLLA